MNSRQIYGQRPIPSALTRQPSLPSSIQLSNGRTLQESLNFLSIARDKIMNCFTMITYLSHHVGDEEPNPTMLATPSKVTANKVLKFAHSLRWWHQQATETMALLKKETENADEMIEEYAGISEEWLSKWNAFLNPPLPKSEGFVKASDL